jgi:hypothetical protein
MNAAMFGMIIPERKVPNFCTAILTPDCPAGAVVDALTWLSSRWDGWTLGSSGHPDPVRARAGL